MSMLFLDHQLQLPEHINKLIADFYFQKTVLITGGTGFIGTHLTQKLQALGATIIIIDDYSNSSSKHNPELFASTTVINDTILHDCAVIKAFKKPVDIVFHLAALRSVPESFLEPQLYHEVNAQGTLFLLKACQEFGVRRFVFSSSAAVYGDYQDVCTENLTCQPTSPYGLSKLNAEKYCTLFAKHFGIDTISLRYFNVYDDLQTNTITNSSAHSTFLNALKNNLPITIEGDGTQQRDFVPLSHIVDTNLLFGMLTPQASGESFNIATGMSNSITTLLSQLQQQFPNYTNTISYLPKRAGDVDFSQASIKKYLDFIDAL